MNKHPITWILLQVMGCFFEGAAPVVFLAGV